MWKQISFPRIVLRTGFGRTSMSKYKSSANHFAFWLPGPQWQQKLFGVLQLLYQLRMNPSPSPSLTKVLKFSRTAHMTPSSLPLARSEPICCTAQALTSCWQCNCRAGVPVVCLGKLQRAIFLMCAEKCSDVEYFPFTLISFSQPFKEPAASAQELYWNYQGEDLTK